jgi:hypothetical protein
MTFAKFGGLSFIKWVAGSWLGQLTSGSLWMFAVIEAVHLLALAAIGGAVLIVDLRLLGFGIREQPIERLARDAHRWFLWSWAVMIVTGILLFFSEPEKLFYSPPFFWKMTSLLLATVFALTIRRKVTLAAEGSVSPTVLKLVALVSLLLWFGVGAGGRWIGFG